MTDAIQQAFQILGTFLMIFLSPLTAVNKLRPPKQLSNSQVCYY